MVTYFFFQGFYLPETRNNCSTIIIVPDIQIYNNIYLFQHILTPYLQNVLCGYVYLIRIHKYPPLKALVMKQGNFPSQKQVSHFT